MIWFILLSIPLGLAYLGWMAVTVWRRRWKKLLIQLAGGLAYLGVLGTVNVVYGRVLEARYFEGLFATSIRLPSPLFHFDSPRHFNGDGYTLEVYPLPLEIRKRFENFASGHLRELPLRPEFRSHWESSVWRPTPATAADQVFIEFAFAFGGSPELNHYQEEAKRAVATTGAYFAYFYFNHGEHPGNVDLFIVDLARDRLFLINLNT